MPSAAFVLINTLVLLETNACIYAEMVMIEQVRYVCCA